MVMDIRDLIARFFLCNMRNASFPSIPFVNMFEGGLKKCSTVSDSEAKPHADKSIIDSKCYTCKMQILIGLKTNYFEPLVCCISLIVSLLLLIISFAGRRRRRRFS